MSRSLFIYGENVLMLCAVVYPLATGHRAMGLLLALFADGAADRCCLRTALHPHGAGAQLIMLLPAAAILQIARRLASWREHRRCVGVCSANRRVIDKLLKSGCGACPALAFNCNRRRCRIGEIATVRLPGQS